MRNPSLWSKLEDKCFEVYHGKLWVEVTVHFGVAQRCLIEKKAESIQGDKKIKEKDDLIS